jgi:hypothetical protein
MCEKGGGVVDRSFVGWVEKKRRKLAKLLETRQKQLGRQARRRPPLPWPYVPAPIAD